MEREGPLVCGIHHVAFAEEQGASLVGLLGRLLGLRVCEVEQGEGFNEWILDAGNCYLQGLEATGDGVVRRSIDKRGIGLHHIAFRVSDIEGAIETLREEGVSLVDERPRVGGGGNLIAFAHPKSLGGVLVEFVQDGGSARVQSGDMPHEF